MKDNLSYKTSVDKLVYEINKQFNIRLKQALDKYNPDWTFKDVKNNGKVVESQGKMHREVYMHDVLILEFDVNTELNEDQPKVIVKYKM